MLYVIGWTILYVSTRILLRAKVVGGDRIPKEGAFIMVSNHVSFLDPVLVGTSIVRGSYFLARDTLFNKPVSSWVLKRLHCIPVKRHGTDLSSLRQALRVLSEGKPLVIFPEGTRSRDGRLKKPKRGVGFLARKARVPVIPAFVKGSFEAMPRGLKTLKLKPVTVFIGEPVVFDGSEEGPDIDQTMSNTIMNRVAELEKTHADTTR